MNQDASKNRHKTEQNEQESLNLKHCILSFYTFQTAANTFPISDRCDKPRDSFDVSEKRRKLDVFCATNKTGNNDRDNNNLVYGIIFQYIVNLL